MCFLRSRLIGVPLLTRCRRLGLFVRYFPWYLIRSLYCVLVFVFFFSSRRRHTRCLSDWSSDVCSSDLRTPRDTPPMCLAAVGPRRGVRAALGGAIRPGRPRGTGSRRGGPEAAVPAAGVRSEERRVGKEGRSRWGPYRREET